MAFVFTPSTGLLDTSAFPSPDTNFRKHLQDLLQQLGTYTDAQIATVANTASLGTSGWFKDQKTGLIIQVGQIVLSNGSGNATNWVYPIAFPHACLYAHCNVFWTTVVVSTSLNIAPGTTFAQFVSSAGNSAVNAYCFAIGN